jgi:hypothetical protein
MKDFRRPLPQALEAYTRGPLKPISMWVRCTCRGHANRRLLARASVAPSAQAEAALCRHKWRGKTAATSGLQIENSRCWSACRSAQPRQGRNRLAHGDRFWELWEIALVTRNQPRQGRHPAFTTTRRATRDRCRPAGARLQIAANSLAHVSVVSPWATLREAQGRQDSARSRGLHGSTRKFTLVVSVRLGHNLNPPNRT